VQKNSKSAPIDIQKERPQSAQAPLKKNRSRRKNNRWVSLACGLCISLITGLLSYHFFFSVTDPDLPPAATADKVLNQEDLDRIERAGSDRDSLIVNDAAPQEAEPHYATVVDEEDLKPYAKEDEQEALQAEAVQAPDDLHSRDGTEYAASRDERAGAHYDRSKDEPDLNIYATPDEQEALQAETVQEPKHYLHEGDGIISSVQVDSSEVILPRDTHEQKDAPVQQTQRQDSHTTVSLRNDILPESTRIDTSPGTVQAVIPDAADRNILSPGPADTLTREEPVTEPALPVQADEPVPARDTKAGTEVTDRDGSSLADPAALSVKDKSGSALREMSADYEYLFSSKGNDWPEYHRPGYSAAIQDGYLLMANTSDSTEHILLYPHEFPEGTEAMFETRISIVRNGDTGSGGIVFNAADKNNNYSFILHADNHYSIIKKSGGVASTVKSGETGNAFIGSSEWKTLKIVNNKKSVQLYIDGYYIDTLEDIIAAGSTYGFILTGSGRMSIDWLKAKFRYRTS
jgi:hypothetical protein